MSSALHRAAHRRAASLIAASIVMVGGLAAPGVLRVERARAEGTAGAGGPLVVAAAASLTEVLPRIAAARGPGAAPVEFRFEASSRLARQIEAGAPTDLFISADGEWVDHLARRGLIEDGSRVDLAGNALVVVVPRDAGRGGAAAPSRPEELSAPSVERLALAGESVPAGRYARASLESLGLWTAVKARVVSGDSVRTALSWVARGEASAGIVYATDARVEPRVRVAFTLPASSHPPIVYPAALVRGAAHAGEARRFLDVCRGPEARALFAAAGFLPPPAAPAPRPGGGPAQR